MTRPLKQSERDYPSTEKLETWRNDLLLGGWSLEMGADGLWYARSASGLTVFASARCIRVYEMARFATIRAYWKHGLLSLDEAADLGSQVIAFVDKEERR